ncbi:NAD-dependent epimerase/dehydratase family protein [Anaeromyxobacter terrae]|uniref:NAD-dependent epimerase/dehydratase family protein n=1 Tax=Anaeromyxobacter terrae TaxID=2925406 RepID=UPI001F5A3073|nr:NAD-dependent epimerase/dehydratase family protein [Anaeromyxobacter sp. SG22]
MVGLAGDGETLRFGTAVALNQGAKMTVLVTGATGFIGGHVVDTLRDRQVAVRALVRPDEPTGALASAGVEIVRGDLEDGPSLMTAVRGVDRVLHCAARTGPWGPRSEYEAANVRGVELLIDSALAAGVKRIVHVSSAIVVGTDVGGTVDESAPLRLEPNPYSWSKIMAERLIERVVRERRAPITVVRPGLVYGPRDAASFGRFAALLERRRMPLMGRGDNHLPLVYVGDVARGIVLASEVPAAIGRTYFLVNDEPVTQREYLEAIAAELGVPPPTRHVPYLAAQALAAIAERAVSLTRGAGPPPLTRFGVRLLGGESRIVIRRAREELGFVPETDLREGVRRSVAWYRAAQGAPRAGDRASRAAGGVS